MINYKKILCPIDFSDFTEKLLSVAIKLSDFDTIIYGYHSLMIPYTIDTNGLPLNMMIEQDLQTSTKSQLEKLEKKYKEDYPDVIFDFSYSLAADSSSSICNKAAEIGADLIVMGTHGRTGLNRLLMGSVAESVLRNAHCPVLMLKIEESK